LASLPTVSYHHSQRLAHSDIDEIATTPKSCALGGPLRWHLLLKSAACNTPCLIPGFFFVHN
jgi:hypothetical protein